MAGIPLIERFVARALIRRHCRANPPESTVRIVRAQQGELVGLIGHAGEAASRRVRIKRLPGLERSSTNYSLAMVADHLARTNTDMARTVEALARNEDPGIVVEIARYKPDPDAAPQKALADLESSIALLESALADPAAIRAATRTLEHPWFGPLTAATWACFPSFHQAIHLKQARLIAQGIR